MTKIFRIVDSKTGLFIRDDFECALETEVALDVPPAQGFGWPRWDGEKWVEGRTPEEIAAIQAAQEQEQEHELTDIEKLKLRQDATENAILFLMDMGGML